MRRFLALIFCLAVYLLAPAEKAEAQNVNLNCFTGVGPVFWAPCGSGNPLVVSSSGSTGATTIVNGSNTAAVKPGNTAATTDQALVVVDPNVLAAVLSPVPCLIATTSTTNTYGTGTTNPANCDVNGNIYVNSRTASWINPASTAMQTNAVANGNGTVLPTTGYSTAVIDVVCTVACSGGTTVNFEATDSVGTYFAIQGTPVAGGTAVTSATAGGQWLLNVAGLTNVRSRISAYSAGTINVTGTVSAAGGGVGSGGGGGTTNVTQFGGTNVSTGTGVGGAGIPRVTISSDSSLAANQSANVAQFGGTNVSTGTGAGGAGIPRVTISNDSSLAANQSTNVAQFGGTNVATGTGAGGSGIPRVTISNDSSLAANQSVNLAQVAGASTAVGSGVQATALRTTLATDSPGIITLGPATIANSVPVIPSSQYPGNATAPANPITASATGTTGATTATLAGVASKTTFICGFTITSDATSALAGSATVTGTVTGTLNYIQNVGSATAAGLLTQSFSPCIPASAANTGIAVNSVAAGTGGNTAVTAWGYQL